MRRKQEIGIHTLAILKDFLHDDLDIILFFDQIIIRRHQPAARIIISPFFFKRVYALFGFK